MTEETKGGLLDLLVLSLVGLLCLLLGVYLDAALGHSWYDPACCSDTDCRPVRAEDVIETDKGWKHLPSGTEFTKDMVKPSQDRRFHVCIGNKPHDMGRPYCIYILQGA